MPPSPQFWGNKRAFNIVAYIMNTIPKPTYQYQVGGSLAVDAPSYIERQADQELYQALKSGNFCYVLNSRQMGKSSLRVRTMARLEEEKVSCAAIDLTAICSDNVTHLGWYKSIFYELVSQFDLLGKINRRQWWKEQEDLSTVQRLGLFFRQVLLQQIKGQIVIFIDEIDSILSLNFPTDDFFAFIRACYNQQVDYPEYKRLTFCLLGVASPTNLIKDKQRTPFNIGQGINLKGFQLSEVAALQQGLQERVGDVAGAVMEEILAWTGGQPFLTQKLCQLMVEESEQEQPRSVEEVVRAKIIDNWEFQDVPEHLRTIRDRIVMRNEQRAGYLLELYQRVRREGEVAIKVSLEQSELQLSGLAIESQGKLRVNNQIYREVFNQNWIETELRSLRPYSESFRFWLASGCEDESRLLRGKALEEAEEWAESRNLSYQDKQFLAASREREIEEEIAVKARKAELEREKKERAAAQKRSYSRRRVS